MFTVVVNGLRKGEATATALDCRAFGCYPDHTYMKDVHFRPASLHLPLLFTSLIVVLVILERTA